MLDADMGDPAYRSATYTSDLHRANAGLWRQVRICTEHREEVQVMLQHVAGPVEQVHLQQPFASSKLWSVCFVFCATG